MKERDCCETFSHKIGVAMNIFEFELAILPKRGTIDCITCTPKFSE